MGFLCDFVGSHYALFCDKEELCESDIDKNEELFGSQVKFANGFTCGLIFAVVYYFLCMYNTENFTERIHKLIDSPEMKKNRRLSVAELKNKLEKLKQQEELKDVGSAFGTYVYSPSKKITKLGVSLIQIGNATGKVLIFQSLTLFIGFASHAYAYYLTGIWYLNPGQMTMKNPGQFGIRIHVYLGLILVVTIAIMATLIKWGGFNSKYRRIHGKLGYYVVGPLSFLFLLSAINNELNVPGPVEQKVSRLLLPIVCIWNLYLIIKSAYYRRIDAHLHYIVSFWGLCCGAGPLRSGTVFSGWWSGCKDGWGANPAIGIFVGTLPSTLFPMIAYIYMNGSWKLSYSRKALGFAAFYQIVALISIPIAIRKGLSLADSVNPCIARADYSVNYPEEDWSNHSKLFYEQLKQAQEERYKVEA